MRLPVPLRQLFLEIKPMTLRYFAFLNNEFSIFSNDLLNQVNATRFVIQSIIRFFLNYIIYIHIICDQYHCHSCPHE